MLRFSKKKSKISKNNKNKKSKIEKNPKFDFSIFFSFLTFSIFSTIATSQSTLKRCEKSKLKVRCPLNLQECYRNTTPSNPTFRK